MNWYYHSRDPHYKFPFGAVRTGETVSLRVDGDPSAMVELLLYLPDGPVTLPMRRDGDAYRAEFTAPAVPCRMGYGFRINGRYFGADSGEARFADTPQTYGLTVYDGAFETPEWFRHAVVYQIFPDRFFCSDRARFLRAASDYRATGRPIFVHDDWNETPYYTPHGGAKDYAPDDYFGGDLSGIREKLPYIASLGVTCIYLNPIFEAHSNHRYNTADYHTIDPLLGTNDDFKALCDAAKAYGVRIVLDGVFSHTGDDSIYFDRYHRYNTHGACESKDSPYYPWYRFYDWPETYECWWNFKTLPDVEETEPSYADFIQGGNGVLRKWLSLGASGWRLDVADELPDSFIRGVRRSIKDFDPDAVLIGEVWDNCATKFGPEGRRGYVNGDELDAPMNYQFREPAIEFLNGRKDAYWFAETQNRLLEDYPKPFMDACLNLLGSHDTERVKTALTGAPDARTLTRAQQLAHRPDAAALARAAERVALGYALMAVLPGVPCIYYGDEAGMTGMSDPLNRGAFPWGREDGALTGRVKALMRLHRESDAIKNGSTRIAAIGRQTVCVIRQSEAETLLLFANAADAPVRASVFPALFREGPAADEPLDLSGAYLDETGETVEARSVLSVTVPANDFRILKKA
ncbi:MAG: glycoside hydrolase family 13 protein [Clostridia bacterium]|nr:glycoside hydrolase family 13 protein [Clostridia bacterium]